MTDWSTPALALAIGYGLGSIPFGIILTRLFGAGDLRQIGSGNIGATNVLRTGRKGLAAGTLLLDLAKGAAAVCITRAMDPSLALIGGIGAFFGHLFPVWIGFRGGKGVATMLGVALAFDWRIGIVFAAAWLGVLAVLRISSLSGMVAALSAPVAAYLFGYELEALVLLGLALVLCLKHADNVQRLLAGTEPRVGQKQEQEQA